MAFVSKDGLGNITGVFAKPQPDSIDGAGNVCPGIPTSQVADNDPALLAYMAAKSAPVDQGDLDRMSKQMKALALCIAQVGGLTNAQMKTMYKAKYDSLP